jgi:hypothetical protein
MDFIVSAPTQQALAVKLIDAGLLLFGETGATAAPGVLYSHIGTQAGTVHGFVAIDESVFGNAADILARLQADINQAGAPLRARAGNVPPEVVSTLPNKFFRRALQSLALMTAWNAAIAAADSASGTKDCAIWWDDRGQISTLEPEWRALCDVMAWKKRSEAELIAEAHRLAEPAPPVAPTPPAEPPAPTPAPVPAPAPI